MRRILILEVRTEVHRLTIRNRLTRPRIVGVVVNSHRLARPIPDRGHIVLHTLTSTISVPLELIAVGLTSPIVWDGTTEVGNRSFPVAVVVEADLPLVTDSVSLSSACCRGRNQESAGDECEK
ncbi:hypothetical protein HMPREF1549_02027 [Actinomyces johnsonii F0510]|uniref:Uncharacterized protein n=1 Tax=Actinomyces johnsonii F0510 TaxID=1227262 RepID=U1Q6I9_9ACTO|nr:hypothetical protein HMPREF1549_02027 [Actinomyces johnsonii F0510]